MKALLAVALIMVPAPVVASAGDDSTVEPPRDRRICTRIERLSGSRLSYTRVCLTQNEWRERLGPDWRQRLAGRSPDEDIEGVWVRSRDWSNIGNGGDGAEGAGRDLRPGGPR